MFDLKACAVCFSTDIKLTSFNSGQLRHEFKLISGIQVLTLFISVEITKNVLVIYSLAKNIIVIECFSYMDIVLNKYFF